MLAKFDAFRYIPATSELLEGEGLGEDRVQEPKRASKTLTAVKLRSTLAPGKYHDGGGLGLYLRVDPSGGRFWVQRITIAGRRRELGLGSPPVVSLAAARDCALQNKQLVRAGGDPLARKRQAREQLTFREAVDGYLSAKTGEFRNEKHRKQWRSTLENYAVPVLGKMPVQEVTVQDVLRVLHPIWTDKTETASRVRGRLEAVLSWATVAGHRAGDNPARWKGNLSEMLPKPGKIADKSNHPALALEDAPRWWAELAERSGIASKALQFLALTAARSGEVRGMTWDEVDLEKAIWIIPAARMRKADREHRVPLPATAVELLRGLPVMAGSPYVFFAPRGGQLSDMSLSAVMRRMHEADLKAGNKGFLDARSRRPAVPHGLRSTLRDWAAERGFDRDLAELALAHKVGSEVERAYRRTDMLERRRRMLKAWADFLGGDRRGEVVSLRGTR